MDSTIELTTSPHKYPARVKRQLWFVVAFVGVIIGFQLFLTLGLTGYSWRMLLHKLATMPSHMWATGDWQGALLTVAMPTVGWLSYQSQRLTLRITPTSIECKSRLPAWVRGRTSDWQIQRSMLKDIRVDLTGIRTVGSAAARLQFVTGDKTRSIRLLGWYRTDRDSETQQAGFRQGFLKTDYRNEVEKLSVFAALKDAGLSPTIVDAAALSDPLRKKPSGWLLALSCIGAVVYGIGTLAFQKDLYAAQPPWWFISVVGGAAGYLAWLVVRGTNMKRDDKIMGVVAAAAMFALAAWAGAPQLNAVTSDGPHTIAFVYQGDGVFKPERTDVPTLDLSRYGKSLAKWKPGDHIELYLIRGALGFWQYDRDQTLAALDKSIH